MVRLVEKRGWLYERTSSSHQYFQSPDGKAHISIPVHGNKSLKTGLQRAIMKDVGLTDADL